MGPLAGLPIALKDILCEQGEPVTVQLPVVSRRGTYSDIPVPSVAPTTAAPEEEHESGH